MNNWSVTSFAWNGILKHSCPCGYININLLLVQKHAQIFVHRHPLITYSDSLVIGQWFFYSVVNNYEYLLSILLKWKIKWLFGIFSSQFSVPGNNIVLSPELFITVLAYTSILNPEAPQVSLLDICTWPVCTVHCQLLSLRQSPKCSKRHNLFCIVLSITIVFFCIQFI